VFIVEKQDATYMAAQGLGASEKEKKQKKTI
jgi:hypothetical protein